MDDTPTVPLTTIDRYVLGKLLRVFLPTCLGLCFVFFLGASFRLLREEDLSIQQVAMALPWVIPFLLPYLVPMAYMSTVTLVYGRMVSDNEVLAFGSLGIGGRTLAWPAILLAAGLSLGMSWLTAEVVPFCYQRKKEAARAVFQQLFSLGRGEHWARTFPKQGFDLYVRRYEPGKLEGIVIHYDAPSGGKQTLPTQIVARVGRIDEESGTRRLVLVLEDVIATLQPRTPPRAGEERKPDPAPIRLHLQRYVQGISLGGRRRIKALDYASGELRVRRAESTERGTLAGTVGGLISTLHGNDRRGEEAEIELSMRPALSLAPLLTTLLVIPLTLLLRARSPLVPFAVGLLAVSILYFAPLLLGRAMAETFGVGELVYVGCAVCLLSGGAFARWAQRV